MPIDYADDPAGQPDSPRSSGRAAPPEDRRRIEVPRAPLDPGEREAVHRAHWARVERAVRAERDGAGGGDGDAFARERGKAGERGEADDRGEVAAAADAWSRAAPGLRASWEKHEARYPDHDRPVPQTRPDGSWSSGESRRLSPDQNAEVNQSYARIRETGERDIVPRVLAVEAADPNRHLAGFEHRIKGEDRLKEKVADRIRSTPGLTPSQALEVVADAVRFTYQYDEVSYASGVRQDIVRLQARGLVEVERRNTWSSEQYRGINGRWKEPESGLIFEVQFHTQASREAKELTHKAYERIRSAVTDPELSELKEFQRHVNAKVQIPPGAADIENYPSGDA